MSALYARSSVSWGPCVNAAATMVVLKTSPILPSVTNWRILATSGLIRPCNPTAVLTFFSFANVVNSSASWKVAPKGHSTKASFPASRAGLIRS